MGISDTIAEFINGMLKEDSTAELQRADLANRFGCVPSQINYVISTRFSPERGYIVESRRGGGGYIRIRRVQMDPKQLMMHTVNAIGDEIDFRSARALMGNAVASAAITDSAARVILSAVTDTALKPADSEIRDRLRASIMKQMILRLLS